MAVTFSYAPDYRRPSERKTFTTRFNPNDVSWTYTVNSNIIDTYGGQVIQVLSVNIDNVTIEGQFGFEGAQGSITSDGIRTKREQDSIWSYNPGDGIPGLMAMTEFFREYFAIQTQGGDPDVAGRYLEIPMTVSYDDSENWRIWPSIIPFNFPSYSRSNEEFAPLWRIEAHVREADPNIKRIQMQQEIARLQEAIGYTPHNQFSDPNLNNDQRVLIEKKLVGNFRAMLPKFTQGEFENMIWNGVSIPNIEGAATQTSVDSTNYLTGEVDAELRQKLDQRGNQ